jgi:hypothetical protein
MKNENQINKNENGLFLIGIHDHQIIHYMNHKMDYDLLEWIYHHDKFLMESLISEKYYSDFDDQFFHDKIFDEFEIIFKSGSFPDDFDKMDFPEYYELLFNNSILDDPFPIDPVGLFQSSIIFNRNESKIFIFGIHRLKKLFQFLSDDKKFNSGLIEFINDKYRMNKFDFSEFNIKSSDQFKLIFKSKS